jgi:uncharacterized RDD family membrane protein YckC
MNVPAFGATHPAGFWVRLVAFAIDLAVIFVAQLLLRGIAIARFRVGSEQAMGPVGFFTLVFAVVYPTVLYAIAGQTLGKLVMRVRVVALDGGLLPLGAAFLRAMAFWITLVFLLGVGQLIGGLRKDKRAIHDLIAGSRTERLPRTVRESRMPGAVADVSGHAYPPSPSTESEPRSSV